jgi:hypothetical protein
MTYSQETSAPVHAVPANAPDGLDLQLGEGSTTLLTMTRFKNSKSFKEYLLDKMPYICYNMKYIYGIMACINCVLVLEGDS